MKKVTMGAVALVVALGLAGCEDDPFEGAPSVSASASAPAQGGAAAPGASDAPGRSGGLGPVEGTELPPGHPPMGQQGGQQGGQMIGGVPAPEVPRMSPEEYGKVGPIRWQVPEGWQAQLPTNAMRQAQYSIPGEAGQEPAELVVFYFGPGGGGGVEANLERWAGQFNGGDPATFAEREVNGVKVHTVDASGTYDAGMAMGGQGPRDEQRMLGAIAETSQGLFFFRMVGPKALIDGQAEGFEAFVSSFEHGEG
ncbi:hypothetical protein FRC98_09195 [Lujinxingia vulgaris]|uniref:Lipoprotein n=1 Tax=Lujinxingia vulgaris TaxID=2600176 RepID=A0A5C6X7M1_9DELT|nr:hypothetical protein [Lujinxingia vulgaris]TXD37843.1 hypothetical protein FRC98_09195 [Lujinxingia vulgaris]